MIFNKKKRKLICSMIMTPDGTILRSNHTHDYVQHMDKNGKLYSLDGGTLYQQCTVYKDAPFTNISVYTDSKFSTIRSYFMICTNKENDNQSIEWIPLRNASKTKLLSLIKYNINRGYGIFIEDNIYYTKELIYRFFH